MRRIRAVTFDCWNTLLTEHPSSGGMAVRKRVDSLAAMTGATTKEAVELIDRAWELHVGAWMRGEAFTAKHMAAWCLAQRGYEDRQRVTTLTKIFEEATERAAMVPNAAAVLRELRARGVRTALVCDTGFSPGRTVRWLLAEHGLLDLLDVQAFSDEVGVPKPSPRMFRRALEGVGADPEEALHVGDLRRTDVAGSRAFGMTAVRFNGVYDDESDGPEGHHVVRRLEDVIDLI